MHAALQIVARVAHELGSKTAQALKEVNHAMNNPLSLIGKITGKDIMNPKDSLRNAAANEVRKRTGIDVDIPSVEGVKRKVGTTLAEIVDRDHMIEIDCTNLKTGSVNTHQFTVNSRYLSDFLFDPYKQLRDAGSQGCSGEPGQTIGLAVRVVY